MVLQGIFHAITFPAAKITPFLQTDNKTASENEKKAFTPEDRPYLIRYGYPPTIPIQQMFSKDEGNEKKHAQGRENALGHVYQRVGPRVSTR